MERNFEPIVSANNKILDFSSEQVQKAISSLEDYITLMQNNNRLFESGIKLTLTGKYDDVSMKRSTLVESKVKDASFQNTALTGSYFSEVSFSKAFFDESNMQYCQFIHNNFKDTEIHSTNLSYSNFYNTDFTHVTFKGSTVAEILFEECIFDQCTFTSSMLENTIFIHCTFRHVKFVNTNIEYMELKNCSFNDVILPMAQVPYVFGLFQNISDETNNISLSADNRMLSVKEYKRLEDDLIIYYTSISEYFPLANMYLADNNLEYAYESISLGMERAIIQRNFRMLKFFCKQAKQGNVFSFQRLKELYMRIEKYVSKQLLNVYEQRSFIFNIGEIRSILLDNMDDFPSARIIMQTNINSSEPQKIAQFIDFIDTALNELCSQKISHIEYSHNSDANFVAFISANYNEIIFLINVFIFLSNNIIDSIQKKIINQQNIILNNIEIKERQKKLNNIKNKGDELQKVNIQYTVQYIIDNPTIDSHNINIFL